jgi:hypothetical protein
MKRRVIALLSSLALLTLSPGLAVAGTSTPDQSNLNFDHLVNGSYIDAQTFTAGMAGSLQSVDLYLSPDPHGSVYLTVQGTTGSPAVPDGTILASDTLNIPASLSGGWFRFWLSATPTMISGHVYAIVFGPTDLVDFWGVKLDSYSRGRALIFSGGAWISPFSMFEVSDFAFQTNVVPAPAPTPTPTHTPTPAPTHRATPAPTHAPTHRPTATPTPAIALTPTPTLTATSTATGTPTSTPTPAAVAAASPTAVVTAEPAVLVAGVTGAPGATATPDPAAGSGSSSGGSNDSTMPILAGGIVLLVVLLGGLGFLLMRRRRSDHLSTPAA